MDSGSTLNLWSLNTRASKIAKLIGTNLLLSTSNTTLLVEKLRKVELKKLVRTAWITGWGVNFPFTFYVILWQSK